MGFEVFVFGRAGEGKRGDIGALPYHLTRAGSSSWGPNFYDSDILNSLGCVLLPMVQVEGILWIEEKHELQQLDSETAIILDNLAAIADATRNDPSDILQVVSNIRNAVARALELEGSVCIS